MSALIAISEIVRNLGLVIAAGFGVYLAWRRVTAANRQAEAGLSQAELARRGHVAELFNQAVGQLTEAKLEVRLGAIYASANRPRLSRPCRTDLRPTIYLFARDIRAIQR